MIVSGARTPMGVFGGCLKTIPVVDLVALALKETLKKIGLRPTATEELTRFEPYFLKGAGMIDLEKDYHDHDESFQPIQIDEVIIENVVAAGQGQNVARQAMIKAFAVQVIACVRELNLDMEKTNPSGSGISIGHPIGCTGDRIILTLMNEMVRNDHALGLATLCIGGGQGMATVLERV